ncbi:MAG TPA: hypothetical protein P5307_03020 [Pirellulaceae bacterium]|nr:hypothetical protein [Pirellulaceae bacterium]
MKQERYRYHHSSDDIRGRSVPSHDLYRIASQRYFDHGDDLSLCEANTVTSVPSIVHRPTPRGPLARVRVLIASNANKFPRPFLPASEPNQVAKPKGAVKRILQDFGREVTPVGNRAAFSTRKHRTLSTQPIIASRRHTSGNREAPGEETLGVVR